MHTEDIDGGLRVFAPAKLNLVLEVGERRSDGFHEIDSIFQTVSLFDEIVVERTDGDSIVLVEDGMADGSQNLVYRAACLLRERHRSAVARAGVRISLRKRIPRGAGLGGGSSDAAATLVALARLWNLDVARRDLEALALQIGSDVPFFLWGGTARCRGRGERVTPYGEYIDHAGPFHYVVLYPGIEVPTGRVYHALHESRVCGIALTVKKSLDSMTAVSTVEQLRSGTLLFNRLEDPACRLFPELREVAAWLRKEPFLGVSMTGSGSAFFGVCRDGGQAAGVAGRLAEKLASSAAPWREGKDGSSAEPAAASRAIVVHVKSEPALRLPWVAFGDE